MQSIFEGSMATCFAYGQTGSGKTHVRILGFLCRVGLKQLLCFSHLSDESNFTCMAHFLPRQWEEISQGGSRTAVKESMP